MSYEMKERFEMYKILIDVLFLDMYIKQKSLNKC